MISWRKERKEIWIFIILLWYLYLWADYCSSGNFFVFREFVINSFEVVFLDFLSKINCELNFIFFLRNKLVWTHLEQSPCKVACVWNLLVMRIFTKTFTSSRDYQTFLDRISAEETLFNVLSISFQGWWERL